MPGPTGGVEGEQQKQTGCRPYADVGGSQEGTRDQTMAIEVGLLHADLRRVTEAERLVLELQQEFDTLKKMVVYFQSLGHTLDD
ncbi:hypothetical protein NDU88_005732 [Pleurodeles waltl]|uniref:Uncharacterized protein n=1 Tax=Pleurodeles waltl TaxID=8319 RepID=A0AAV7TVN8_PLEWA|nr:hypothetical protein NDU88_005732 [Pleurodeles waltl]